VRFDRGGEILTPGAPSDPLQIIDVRDLGAWLITLVENASMGVFNTAGPTLKWGEVVAACQRATPSKSTLTWVPGDWLDKQAKDAFPIWAPYFGEYKGFHTWSSARAVKAGLKYRPHAQTVADTLKWFKSQGQGGRTRLAGPTAEKEAELLATWKKSRP
jgi:2'-hydroxyisoflavone reductase